MVVGRTFVHTTSDRFHFLRFLTEVTAVFLLFCNKNFNDHN